MKIKMSAANTIHCENERAAIFFCRIVQANVTAAVAGKDQQKAEQLIAEVKTAFC